MKLCNALTSLSNDVIHFHPGIYQLDRVPDFFAKEPKFEVSGQDQKAFFITWMRDVYIDTAGDVDRYLVTVQYVSSRIQSLSATSKEVQISL